MASYNAVAFIDYAIESVLKQSHTDWELIIVNDGSSDSTEKRILNYTDQRIRYKAQSNKGVSNARNTGLALMSGDYFCFLDADDILPPESLKARLKIFEEYLTAKFVDGAVAIFDGPDKGVTKRWQPSFTGEPFNHLLRLDAAVFFGPTWMIKRKPGKTYAFKEGLTHCEDLLFYMELAREGGIYDYTDEVVLHYRKGHASAMSNLDGLEKGYRTLLAEVNQWPDVTQDQKDILRIKIRSIMAKSYLSKGQLKKSINALIRI